MEKRVLFNEGSYGNAEESGKIKITTVISENYKE